MRNLLALTQEFCRRIGLPVPSSVVSSLDTQVLQIWALLNEGQMDLGARANTKMMIHESTQSAAVGLHPMTFVHAGYGQDNLIAAFLSELHTEIGGGVPNILPASLPTPCYLLGFTSFVSNTFWETTTRTPVAGPLTESEWTAMQVMSTTPARYTWKTDYNYLYIKPYSATARFTCMYYTRFAVVSSDGESLPPDKGANWWPTLQTFALDEDWSILPDHLVLQDLKWRWRAAKGLPYAEDMRVAEQMLQNFQSNEPYQDVHLDNEPSYNVGPGLYIAAGNTIPP